MQINWLVFWVAVIAVVNTLAWLALHPNVFH